LTHVANFGTLVIWVFGLDSLLPTTEAFDVDVFLGACARGVLLWWVGDLWWGGGGGGACERRTTSLRFTKEELDSQERRK
jgi:hypothetical protein